jgi:rubrerythrin
MQNIESALAVLHRAIADEIAGQRFYDEAAYYCVDLWAKETFASLAREEEEHTRLLLAEYNALSTDGQWLDLETARASDAIDITVLGSLDHEPVETMFPSSGSVAETVDRTADDLAALALGIKMEQMAIELYGQQARTADDPAVREAYGFLLEEETRHHSELKAQWERLAGTAYEGA